MRVLACVLLRHKRDGSDRKINARKEHSSNASVQTLVHKD